MAETDLQELSSDVQEKVDAIISETKPTEWSEDHISMKLVQGVRDVLVHASINDFPGPAKRVDVELYKLTGRAEKTSGDIAVVVQRRFSSAVGLKGVAFYEAKRADDSGAYPAFRIKQAQRLLLATPFLQFLTYERQATAIAVPTPHNWYHPGWDHYFRRVSWERRPVCARVTGANLVVGLGSLNSALASYSDSFGRHLCERVLTGRELDFRDEPGKLVESWLKKTKRTSPIVVSIAVGPAGTSAKLDWRELSPLTAKADDERT